MTIQNRINNPARARTIRQQVLLTSSVYVPPANLVSVIVECVSGGGGSGGASGTTGTQASGSGGGGGGGYSRRSYNRSQLLPSVAYTIGAGGAAGPVAGAGGDGGTTSWGSFQNVSGGGGSITTPSSSSTIIVGGAAGGFGSGGTFNQAGENGRPLFMWATTPVRTFSVTTSSPGFGGGRYGRAARAVYNPPSSSAVPGAAGSQGVIILTEILST